MADDVDRANDLAEQQLQDALQKARKVNRTKPTGFCKNCSNAVGDKKIFCDDECREDYEWYTKRKSVNQH